MKIETILKRIDNCNKRISGFQKSIERWKKENEKYEKALAIELEKGDEDSGEAWTLRAKISGNVSEINSKEKNLNYELKSLAKWEAMEIEVQSKTPTVTEIPEIEEFLENYRSKLFDYYIKTIPEYIKSVEKYNIELLALKEKMKIEKKRYNDRFHAEDKLKKSILGSFGDEFGRLALEYKDGLHIPFLNKILDEDIKASRIKLFNDCFPYIGNITKAKSIETNVNGILNGIFEGESGICRVNSDLVAGYNIVKLHVRTTVHKLI